MSEKLKMQNIVGILVAENDISKEDAEEFVAKLFNLIEKELTNYGLAIIQDFGTFKLTHTQECESVGLDTKEGIVKPAHRCVGFIPAQLLEDLVNKPFAHFETTCLNEGVFEDGIPHNQDATSQERSVGSDEDKTAVVNQSKEPLSETIPPAVVLEGLNNEEKELLEDFLPTSTTILTNTEKTSAPKENLIKDDKGETVKDNFTTDVSNSNSESKPTAKSNLRNHSWLWGIAIMLLIVFVASFYFNYSMYSKLFFLNDFAEEGETSKSIGKTIIELSETPISETGHDQDSIKETEQKVQEVAETVKMTPGRTLRLVALDKFGDREFWVYIYLKNKDKIKDPNIVPVGLELTLPREGEYPIDATSTDAIAEAKRLGDKIIKSF